MLADHALQAQSTEVEALRAEVGRLRESPTLPQAGRSDSPQRRASWPASAGVCMALSGAAPCGWPTKRPKA